MAILSNDPNTKKEIDALGTLTDEPPTLAAAEAAATEWRVTATDEHGALGPVDLEDWRGMRRHETRLGHADGFVCELDHRHGVVFDGLAGECITALRSSEGVPARRTNCPRTIPRQIQRVLSDF